MRTNFSYECKKRTFLPFGKVFSKSLLAFFLVALFGSASLAQQGYIYLHKRALDENSSPDFTFSIASPSTTLAPQILNDQATPFLTPVMSLGGDAGGGLWAIGGSSNSNGDFPIYYRAPNSSTWVSSPGYAKYIDGGAPGTRITAAGGGVWYYDGTTQTDITYGLTNVTFVSDNWSGIQYAVLDNGEAYTKTTAATSWTPIPGISSWVVDAIPNTNQLVYIEFSGYNVIKSNNDGTGAVDLGNPDGSGSNIVSIAVTGDGTIFADQGNNIYRYSGTGTSWVKEPEGFNVKNITGGPVSQLWGAQFAASDRIYSRTETGNFIADENIRTSALNDNSVLIPVSPGRYTITESPVAGWRTTAIDIYETQSVTSTKNIGASTAEVEVNDGEVVHVVFENQFIESTPITNNCDALAFVENFDQGTGYGTLAPGLTSYHKAEWPYGFGYYALINNTSLMGTYTGNYTDHTGNLNGRMLAVDATNEKGTFYRRNFTGLIPNAQYTFTAWAMNVNTESHVTDMPNISFEVYNPQTGELIASGNTGDLLTPGLWKSTSFVFSTTLTEVDLVLRNNTTGSSGNDVAIDDISFGLALPTPVAMTTDPSCTTAAGSITVTSPVNQAYEYSIDGTNYQSSPEFSNLTAGSYSVTVRYAGNSGCTSPSTAVTIAATPACPPTAEDDSSLGNTTGSNVTINILTNDVINSGAPATPSNTTVAFNTTGLPAGSTISGNTITVPGEGVYTYDPATGNLLFDPNDTFVGNPTPLNYTLTEIATGLSDPAVVTITYSPLPVKLVSFNVLKHEMFAFLTWSTTEEVNSDLFEIERSSDTKNWAPIGKVSSIGESKVLVEYSFVDNQPLNGLNYYRMKMIDKDGTFAYSRIRSLEFNRAALKLNLHPNPASDILFVKDAEGHAVAWDKVKDVSIVNTQGAVVYKLTSPVSSDGIKVSGLATGIYVVKIKLADGTLSTHKVIVGR